MLVEKPSQHWLGRALSHYHILSLLGTGGMGEVYLAQDSKLGRKVALKLLPARFTQDEELVHRFEQEARAASALNHPNIITIHEIDQVDDTYFIATELIEGETLRQRLANAQMTPGEALEVAIQVAAALAAAHEAGIIHRDIKPENIMLRRDGYVKVLDFGLAKLIKREDEETDGLQTLLKFNTDPGRVMGTVYYLSPEQARGLKVDGRTDLFNLGVVLYEMLAGRKPFAGPTGSDVIASLLKTEPVPLQRLVSMVPEAMEWIITKALMKDREERYQTAKEMLTDLKRLKQRLELEAEIARSGAWAASSRASPAASQSPLASDTAQNLEAPSGVIVTAQTGPLIAPATDKVKQHRLGMRFALAALFVVMVGIAFAFYQFAGQRQSRAGSAARPPQVVPLTTLPGEEDYAAFSPDGKQIAYAWREEREGNFDVYVKLVDAGAPLRLTTNPATETNPVWSPDGRFIAFLRQSADNSGIYLIPALGGSERKLAEVLSERAIPGHYLSYAPDGKSVLVVDKEAAGEPCSIFSLDIETGERRKLTSPPTGFIGDASPALSPDGRTLAFCRSNSVGALDIYVLLITGGEPQRITSDNRDIFGLTWTADGREIVYSARRLVSVPNLWRVPATGGTPERVPATGQVIFNPTIARQGNRLAYTQYLSDTNIWRIDLANAPGRDQAPTKLIYSTLQDGSPSYSPDGRKIVFTSTRSGNSEIWVCGSDGEQPSQLSTLGGPLAGTPHWSHDGRYIAFDGRSEGNVDIFVIGAEGGKSRRLTTEPSEDMVPSWSHDGHWIYFCSNRSGSLQVWKTPVAGGQAVQVTKQGGFEAFESFDGKYLYYSKGRNVPGIWRVSITGGDETLVVDLHKAGYWRSWAVANDGIYFATALTATRPIIEFFSFATGKVKQIALLDKDVPQSSPGLTVSPDGRRLLYTQIDQRGSDIMLIENFH